MNLLELGTEEGLKNTHLDTKLTVDLRRSSVGEMIVCVSIAAETFINPAPCWVRVCKGSLLFVLEGTFCAVDSKRLRMPCAVCFVLPLAERSSAAEPATLEVAAVVLDT
jgi:hypothetical protein